MKKPTDRKERPTIAAYRMFYGRLDKSPPKPAAQPSETPPPKK